MQLDGLTICSYAQLPETKLGWKIGVQSYTFRKFTLAQALDKMESCGVKYAECYASQQVGGGIEGTMDYRMDSAKQQQVLKLFKKKGIKLYSYGVISPATEGDWITVFKFAKAMGLVNISSEPAEADIPLVSRLADQYGINVAIHDHPRPAHYWNPDTVLKVLTGQSKRLGACADIGHWIRSGLDPLECLKKLEGHIIELHFKDLDQQGMEGHDVPWGNGVSNIPAVLRELKRQDFKGALFAEYEYNWMHSMPEVATSVKNLRTMIREL